MKNLRTLLAVFALSMAVAISNPTLAQSAGNGSTSAQSTETEHDDSGKWGLLGLLGLAGLLGLRKKEDHRVHSTTTNR